MLDEKLNHLSIMNTESGFLWKLDYSDIIFEFVKRKAKKCFIINFFAQLTPPGNY